MKKDFSPEEKLLRLIKGPRRLEADRDRLEMKPALPSAMGSASSYYKGNEHARPKSAALPISLNIRDINTKNINPVLVIILAGLLIYFLIDMIHDPYYGKESQLESAAEKEPAEVKEKKAPVIEPYSYYATGLDSRNIFLSQESETSAIPAGPSLEEISANLSLIGIMEGRVVMEYHGETFELVL